MNIVEEIAWLETRMRLKIIKPKGVTSLIVRDCGRFIYLSVISVDPEQRNKGIGSQVIKTLQAMRRPIRLQANADSESEQIRLERFYKRHGFKPVVGAIIVNTFEWTPV